MALNSNSSLDVRQSSLWGKYLEELSWQAIELKNGYFAFVRNLPLLGSTIKIPRAALPIPFKEIDGIAGKYNAFLVKLEPSIERAGQHSAAIRQLLGANGFSFDRWALCPTRTIQIDLTKSEDELLKAMEKDTRYSVRLAIRRGVKVEQTDDFAQFKTLYFATAKRKRFWVAKRELEALWKVFSKEKAAAILTAFYKEEPVASTLLLFHEKKGYYYHAASSEKHRDVMAPYLLLWQVVRFLKSKNCALLDLEGIYDPRNPVTKRWKGFTLFKRGFGGREVEYIESFVKYPRLWSKLLFLPTRFF